MESLVQEFIGSDLYSQRSMLIQLLISDDKSENLYIAYLLYDVLSDDKLTNDDSSQQKKIYNSLNWNCKKNFKNALQKTVEYTNDLLNFDSSKIPLEQQICLMKANDNIKEKAMQKLKEIKSKSEDSGSKARQYLDGLLKIPFGIFKIEKILKISQENQDIFKQLTDKIEDAMENDNKFIKDIDIKDNINITFVGEINAGKSSLINSLIGEEKEWSSQWPFTVKKNKALIKKPLLLMFLDRLANAKIEREFVHRFLLDVQNYQLQLYNTGNDDLLKNMREIEAITKLATYQMICDGDADQDELVIMQNLPERMQQHIDSWGSSSGIKVRITIRIGGSSSSRSSDDEDVISKEELCEIINTTITELNELSDDKSTTEYLENLAAYIDDSNLQFHVLKMLVDLSAADDEFHENELEWLAEVSEIWNKEEDLLDFMYMKTDEEWVFQNGTLVRS